MALISWKSIPPVEQVDPAAAQAETLRKERELFLSNISSYLRGLWETAKRAKNNQESKMIKWLRARNGQYEPTKLAAIRQIMGADYDPIFMKITETKCRAAESWIKDLIFIPGKKPYTLEPTPIPELPEDMMAMIEESVVTELGNEIAAQATMTGMMLSPQQMAQAFQTAMPMVMERIDKEIKEKAKLAAKKMEEKIDDQFSECGWRRELAKSIYDMVTFGPAIFKGPCLRRSKVWTRKINPQTGQYESYPEERTIPKWERVNPFDWYPSPDAVPDNPVWAFHRIRLTRKQISDLIGVPGYKESEIRLVLQEFSSGGLREWTNIDQQKAELEGRDTISIWASELIDCLEYSGSVNGKLLLDWGLTTAEIPDPDKEYDVIAWLIGRHVVRCVLNPDLGRYFYIAGFSESPDSVWPKGVPELIEHVQALANAAARAVVHNLGVAAGPQVEVNVDRLDPGENSNIWPWKVWKTTSQGMMESPAVKFYQPNMVTQRLLEIFNFCLSAADDDSGIPRYVHTGEQTGAGDTASGLSMLMGHASKGVKLVINNLDNGIIVPSVESQYRYNLRYEGDDSKIIGDIRVVPHGSTEQIAKEQQVVRTIEMLDRTNNPTDLQLLGLRGRAELMRPALVGIGVDVDKVLGDEEEIERRAAMMAQPAPPPPEKEDEEEEGEEENEPEAMRDTDQAGNPVTGKDTGTFASPEGSKP